MSWRSLILVEVCLLFVADCVVSFPFIYISIWYIDQTFEPWSSLKAFIMLSLNLTILFIFSSCKWCPWVISAMYPFSFIFSFITSITILSTLRFFKSIGCHLRDIWPLFLTVVGNLAIIHPYEATCMDILLILVTFCNSNTDEIIRCKTLIAFLHLFHLLMATYWFLQCYYLTPG